MSAIQKEIWSSQIPILIFLSPSLVNPSPAPSQPTSPPSESPRNSPKPLSKPSSPALGISSSSFSKLPPQNPIPTPDTPLPYAVNIPRLSYLPLLLPKLSAFFGKKLSSFSYEGIELRPLPVGLLVDLYQPALPWKIEVGEGFGGGMKDAKGVEDAWMNSVKEADHLRNGTAKAIMSMSREDSTSLWHSVLDSDLTTYLSIHSRLLSSSNPLRHIPLRIFIPQPTAASPPNSPPPASPPPTSASPQPESERKLEVGKGVHTTATGSFKVVQSLVPARSSSRESTTVGMALNSMLPGLFPSRRDAILAEVVLHGVRLPLRARLEEVMREAGYADGWVNLVVVMLG